MCVFFRKVLLVKSHNFNNFGQMQGLQCAILDLFQFRKDSCTIAASSRL